MPRIGIFLIALLLFLTHHIAFSQDHKITGKVIDAEDQLPLPGAVVIFRSLADSLIIKGTVTGEDGYFHASLPAKDSISLTINFTGFRKKHFIVYPDSAKLSLGIIKLSPGITELGAVEIITYKEPVRQFGDTIEYNAAGFKTGPNASTEDLLAKLPGIIVNGNEVSANGEPVLQIYLDGKPYFTGNMNEALKNIPAEIIEKIQVYNKRSEQAQFTGFDDGQSVKTINIVTKPDKRNGQFGRFGSSYGNNKSYAVDGNINLFQGNRRITVTGGNNHRNAGTNKSNNTVLGLNYTDSICQKTYLTGSYLRNNTKLQNENEFTKKYTGAGTENMVYKEANRQNTANINHRLDLQIFYKPGNNTTLIFSPGISFSKANSKSLSFSETAAEPFVQNRTERNLNSGNEAFNFSYGILINHKLKRQGSSISARQTTRLTNSFAFDTTHTSNLYFINEDSVYLLQQSVFPAKDFFSSATITYTQASGKNGFLQLAYNASYKKNLQNRQAFISDIITNQEILLLDSSRTNNTNTQTIINEPGISYKLSGEKRMVTLGLNLQHTILYGKAIYPNNFSLKKMYVNPLPNAALQYKISPKRTLNLTFQTSTILPALQQLQEVISNTNNLFIQTGNPDLLPQYNYNINTTYSTNLHRHIKAFFTIAGGRSDNMISQSIAFLSRDSLLFNNFVAQKGAQLIKPVNITGAHHFNTNTTISLPINKVKSNLSFTGGFTYRSAPAIFNKTVSLTKSLSFYPRIVLSSNNSGNLDFNIHYSPTYTIIESRSNYNQARKFSSHALGVKAKYIFFRSWYIQSDFAYNRFINTQFSHQNQVLWNAETGKKILPKQNAEIKFTVTDILNHGRNYNQSFTELYTQEYKTNIFSRLYLLSLVYNLKNFTR